MQNASERKCAHRHSSPGWCPAIAAAMGLIGGIIAAGPAAAQNTGDWPMAGQNLDNTRSAANEHTIGLDNVGKLAPRWSIDTDGNVSATPTVVDGIVYFPDWGGTLWAVNAANGQVKWKKKVGDYTGIPNDVSRTSPAYWNGMLVIGQGTQLADNATGAYLIGIKANDGSMLWHAQVDSEPTAIITASPVIDNGVMYSGVSSRAEALNETPKYRGSVVALDAKAGNQLWKTYIVPEGYTGGSVWGNTPVVDHESGLLYVSTGNNFSVPDGVCRYQPQKDCQPAAAANHIDSIVALDLKTGKIVWATRTLPADMSTNFDHKDGPDYDFGSGPNLFTTTIDGHDGTLVGAGQKSGVYWALDPKTGKIVWQARIGPGSLLGGVMWGTAADGKRIYASIGNLKHESITVNSPSGKMTTTGGIWAAVDAATGEVLWRTADPQNTLDTVAMSEANGVVYAGSLAGSGTNMYALDAATGEIKWSFGSGGAVVSGAAIVDGSVYWGTGYHTRKLGLPYDGDKHKLYAFAVAK
jgi:polyvinyl alcohol dehydrogenase (cytochrome)